MDSKGIEYKEYKLGTDYIVEEFVNKFGRNSTFPRVLLDDEVIGGMKETLIYLKSNGYVWTPKYKQGIWKYDPKESRAGGG